MDFTPSNSFQKPRLMQASKVQVIYINLDKCDQHKQVHDSFHYLKQTDHKNRELHNRLVILLDNYLILFSYTGRCKSDSFAFFLLQRLRLWLPEYLKLSLLPFMKQTHRSMDTEIRSSSLQIHTQQL